jgi:transposase
VETLDQVFNTHGQDLKAVEAAHSLSSTTSPDGTVVVPIALPSLTVQEQQRTQQRRTRRLSTYQQVWSLHRQGYKAPAIARQLGIGKTSVFRYLRTPSFPERQGRSDRGRSVLSPYKEYILKRWNEGCYDTKGLFEAIQKRGYSGSYDTVARYTRRLRSSQGLPLRQRLVRQPLPKVAQPEKRPLTAPKSSLACATAARVTEVR